MPDIVEVALRGSGDRAAPSLGAGFNPLGGQAFASSRFHAICQLMDGVCIVISVFASSDGVESDPSVAAERFSLPITLDQQAQAFTNNFISCSIYSRGNPLPHNLFQLGRERYIHLTQPYPLHIGNVKNALPRSTLKT